MEQASLPEWESQVINEAIRAARLRLDRERTRARQRALQLAREQGYHRLAVAIDRPRSAARHTGQLSLFDDNEPPLFDEGA